LKVFNAYYDSLKAAQQRLEWQELVCFVSDAIVGTVNELLTTRNALRRLGAIWRNRRKFACLSAKLYSMRSEPAAWLSAITSLG
jgi:hypothetical protein